MQRGQHYPCKVSASLLQPGTGRRTAVDADDPKRPRFVTVPYGTSDATVSGPEGARHRGSAARAALERLRTSVARLPDLALVLGALTASALSVTVTAISWQAGLLDGKQQYTDIIAGELALDDANKTGDFHAGLLFLASLAVILPLVLWRLPRLPRLRGGVRLAAAALRMTHTRPGDLALGTLLPVFGLMGLASLGASLTGTPLLAGLRHSLALNSSLLLLATLFAILLALAGTASGRLSRRLLDRAVLVLQIPLPLALLGTLHGEHIVDGEIIILGPPGATRLLFAATALVLGAWQFNHARRRWRFVPRPLSTLIAPATVASVVILTTLSTPAASGLTSADDFHNGEQLIQWRQLTHFNLAAYDEFIPVPGLVGALVGGVNELVLGGTAATFPVAGALVRLGLALLVVLSLTAAVGRLWGLAFAALACTLTSDRVLVPLALLTVLAVPRLVRAPRRWLVAWSMGCMVAVSLMPASGTAATLATFPAAAVMVRLSWRERQPTRARGTSATRRCTAAVVGIALASILAPLLLPYTLDLVRYLSASGAANTPAYGLSLTQYAISLPSPAGLPQPLVRVMFEAVRFSGWLVALPVLVVLATRALARIHAATVRPALILALTSGAFLLCIIPYAWGRIDPDHLSRAGALSLSICLFVLPAVMWQLLDRARGIAFVAFIAAALVSVVASQQAPSAFLAAALGPSSADHGQRVYAGGGVQKPHLGPALLAPERVDVLRSAHSAISAYLGAGETFYDMANASALYEVLDRPVAAPFSSEYYAPDATAQRVVLEALKAAPPPVALVATRAWSKNEPYWPVGISPSLRSYRIYRWFLDRGYQPVTREGVHLLVEPGRVQPLDSEQRGQELAQMLRPTTLKALPIAWGRSWQALAPRFGPPSPLQDYPPSSASHSRWALPAERDEDYLLLDVACADQSSAPRPSILRWGTEPHQTLELLVRHGRHLVPLASNPDWLHRVRDGALTLELQPGSACAKGTASAALVHLRD